MKTDNEKINKAKAISKFTKHIITFGGGHYMHQKVFDYLIIVYNLKLFKKEFPILEVHDNFINTLKYTIKLIYLNIRYIFYSKYENDKKIKEHKKNVEKLESKHIKFE